MKTIPAYKDPREHVREALAHLSDVETCLSTFIEEADPQTIEGKAVVAAIQDWWLPRFTALVQEIEPDLYDITEGLPEYGENDSRIGGER